MSTDTGAVFLVHRTIAVDHPAFAGHFPGDPLLPGVCLLTEVIEALAAEPALARWVSAPLEVAQAKFLAPVRPGQAIALTLKPQPGGLQFEVHRDDGVLAANGRLAAAAPGGIA